MKQILALGMIMCVCAITAIAICYGVGDHSRTGTWEGLVIALGVEAIYLITVFAIVKSRRGAPS